MNKSSILSSTQQAMPIMGIPDLLNTLAGAFAIAFEHLHQHWHLESPQSLQDANPLRKTNSVPENPNRQRENKTMSPQTLEVFISYSHVDDVLRTELDTHLALLRRENVISTWYDHKIGGGEEIEREIRSHLNSAHIILLLISADFINSKYCYEEELKTAMERHQAKTARVIPVILRECDWESANFGQLKALPKDGKAVMTWLDRDEALTDVVKGIRSVVETLLEDFR